MSSLDLKKSCVIDLSDRNLPDIQTYNTRVYPEESFDHEVTEYKKDSLASFYEHQLQYRTKVGMEVSSLPMGHDLCQ